MRKTVGLSHYGNVLKRLFPLTSTFSTSVDEVPDSKRVPKMSSVYWGNTCLYGFLDNDVSLGWVEGCNEPPVVPTPSGGSLCLSYRPSFSTPFMLKYVYVC